jgi:predicted regulator of Ras-like GTPase activity (Roadblock/LC7/MglB family)
VSDELRRLSEEMAQDPGSLAFLRLGELLRRRRELESAAHVAARGRDRHPGLADAHDLVARVAADRGDLGAAAESWQAAVRIAPGHAGANKGLGFLAYREGRLRDAVGHLTQAAHSSRDDAAIASALAKVRADLESAPRARPSVTPTAPVPAVRYSHTGLSVFADLAAETETVLLVDRDGLVLAGTAPRGGADRSAEIGAHLTGVSDEATRAIRHLDLGAWTALVIEAPGAAVALSPVGEDGVVLVAAPRTTPLGLVKRQLARAAERAHAWLEGG